VNYRQPPHPGHVPTPVGAVTNLLENSHPQERNLKFLARNLKVEAEIQAITKALAETNWNRKRVARLLNISYGGLLYKIRQHGITQNCRSLEITRKLDKRTQWRRRRLRRRAGARSRSNDCRVFKADYLGVQREMSVTR